MHASHEEKLRAYGDPVQRQKLRDDLQAPGATQTFSGCWDLMLVEAPKLPKNTGLRGKSVAQIAAEQGKDPLDAFLDLSNGGYLRRADKITALDKAHVLHGSANVIAGLCTRYRYHNWPAWDLGEHGGRNDHSAMRYLAEAARMQLDDVRWCFAVAEEGVAQRLASLAIAPKNIRVGLSQETRGEKGRLAGGKPGQRIREARA